MKRQFLFGFASLALSLPALAQHTHGHEDEGQASAQSTAAHHGESAGTITVEGEVLDLVCYIDHEARGAKHADCARTGIESGLPVGIKAADGTLFLLVGEHKPLNEALAAHAAKTITVRGKAATRDGVHLLENVEIVTQ